MNDIDFISESLSSLTLNSDNDCITGDKLSQLDIFSTDEYSEGSIPKEILDFRLAYICTCRCGGDFNDIKSKEWNNEFDEYFGYLGKTIDLIPKKIGVISKDGFPVPGWRDAWFESSMHVDLWNDKIIRIREWF